MPNNKEIVKKLKERAKNVPKRDDDKPKRKKVAGRKKGTPNKKTIETKIAFEAFRQRVLKAQDELMNSQFSIAKGQSFLLCKKYDKKHKPIGRPFIVKDIEKVIDYLNGDLEDNQQCEYFYITTERANNQAIDSLFDRTFGKAQNKIGLGLDGGDDDNDMQLTLTVVKNRDNVKKRT